MRAGRRRSRQLDRAGAMSARHRRSAAHRAVAGGADRRRCASRAAQIVYVSCDPPTLARDAAKLVAAGYALDVDRGVRSVSEHAARRDASCGVLEWRQGSHWPCNGLRAPVSASSRPSTSASNSGENSPVAPEVLRMPLHADAEARPGRSIASIDAVGRGRRDDEPRRDLLDRLMMPAVDRDSASLRSAAGATRPRRGTCPATTMTSCAIASFGSLTLMRERRRIVRSGCPARACRRRRRSAPARRGRSRAAAGRARAPRARAPARSRRAPDRARPSDAGRRRRTRAGSTSAPPVSSTPSQPSSAAGSGSRSGSSTRDVARPPARAPTGSRAWARRRR